MCPSPTPRSPSGNFDPHGTQAALDQLVDVAREKANERATRFGIILREARTLLYNPSFQHLLPKLIGSKEQLAIAKEIQNALKQSPPVYFPRNSNTSRVLLGPYPRLRQVQVCL